MRVNSIINRYIFKEMLPPFLISLGFLTFVFLLTKIIDITNLVVNCQAALTSVIYMIVYSMPVFLVYTIPMSVMMAVLLTFLKMASEMEIVAIKAGGGNIWPLLLPVLLFCSIGMIITLAMTVYAAPWGKYSYKKLETELISSGIEMNLREGVFNNSFTDVMIYIGTIDSKTKMLGDIFIDDRRNKENASTVVAPRGQRFFDETRGVFTLRLFDSIITRVDVNTGRVNTIKSKTYDINIPIVQEPAAGDETKDRDEMTLTELVRYANSDSISASTRLKAEMELQEKFALPFACITLGILAVPLGVRSAFSRKGSGPGLGFACFMGYYLLLMAGGSLGKSGELSPVIAMWGPDIVTGVIGLLFFYRAAREESIGLEPVIDLIKRLTAGRWKLSKVK